MDLGVGQLHSNRCFGSRTAPQGSGNGELAHITLIPLSMLFSQKSGCRKRSGAKGVRSLFFVFGMLSVTFRSLSLMLLSLFSSLFCQTPFAGLLLRQGEKKRGLAEKKTQFLCFFTLFCAFFGPKKAPFPCFRIFYPRFFRQNCAFLSPRMPFALRKKRG